MKKPTCLVTPLLVLACLLVVVPEPVQAQKSRLVREAGERILSSLRGAAGRDYAQELAELGGERAVHELTERLVRTGGDEALAWTVQMTRVHGADTLRALKQAPDPTVIQQAVDELPVEQVDPAFRRLAAPEGRRLAQTIEQHGAAALRAEVRHPGIGGELVRHLGPDGARVARQMETPQAITLGRHAPDIARLPAEQKAGVLRLLREDAEGVVRWMGEFTAEHPGKVLFTASFTTLLLANPEWIGGTPPGVDETGNPIPPGPGVPERLLDSVVPPVTDRVVSPVVDAMIWILLPILAMALVVWLAIKLWFAYRRSRLRYQAAAISTGTPCKPDAGPFKPSDREPADSAADEREIRERPGAGTAPEAVPRCDRG